MLTCKMRKYKYIQLVLSRKQKIKILQNIFCRTLKEKMDHVNI